MELEEHAERNDASLQFRAVSKGNVFVGPDAVEYEHLDERDYQCMK